MKAYIGPYKDWIGPYQIAEKLMFWTDKYTDRRVHKFGTWLAEDRKGNDSLLHKICSKIDSKRRRNVMVKIDNYDTWSIENTLAFIIHPLLVEFRKTLHGAPPTDDEDVPEHLRANLKPDEEVYDTDANWHKRWEWILDEMIWTFEQFNREDQDSQFYHYLPKELGFTPPEGWQWISGLWDRPGFWIDRAGSKAYHARIDNGLRLFGKYYRALWD